jgi:hypothetical protein
MISSVAFALSVIATAQSSVGTEASTLFVQLHTMDWSGLDVETLEHSRPGYFKRVDAEIPADSAYKSSKCDGSTYLIHDVDPVYLRLEFQHLLRGSKCATSLRAVTLEQSVAEGDAERLRVHLIADLGAAGPVPGTPDEYQWRSDDSRTKFVFSSTVDRVEGEKEARRERLTAKLRHVRVSPEGVDALPFRRGYFPPACKP